MDGTTRKLAAFTASLDYSASGLEPIVEARQRSGRPVDTAGERPLQRVPAKVVLDRLSG